jgi:anti-sigma factor RsiW
MRCRAIQRAISDEIDGSLSLRRRRRLDRHLASCPSCREYRSDLGGLQARAAHPPNPAVSPGYWEASLERLRAKLEAERRPDPGRSRPRTAAISAVPRWAWAAVPAVLAAAAGLFVVLRPSPLTVAERLPLAHEEATGRLVAMIGDDEALEAKFVDLIQASILEDAAVEIREPRLLLYGDSRFLDGLSEEELQKLETRLAKELEL